MQPTRRPSSRCACIKLRTVIGYRRAELAWGVGVGVGVGVAIAVAIGGGQRDEAAGDTVAGSAFTDFPWWLVWSNNASLPSITTAAALPLGCSSLFVKVLPRMSSDAVALVKGVPPPSEDPALGGVAVCLRQGVAIVSACCGGGVL